MAFKNGNNSVSMIKKLVHRKCNPLFDWNHDLMQHQKKPRTINRVSLDFDYLKKVDGSTNPRTVDERQQYHRLVSPRSQRPLSELGCSQSLKWLFGRADSLLLKYPSQWKGSLSPFYRSKSHLVTMPRRF